MADKVANVEEFIPDEESAVDETTIDEIVKKYRGKPGELLLILESLQKANKYKYLPEELLTQMAEKLEIPLSKIYSVATFFSFFNLIPQGEHCITICRGTACHTKRSRYLLDYLVNLLNIDEPINENEKIFMTTPDRQFTIRTIACFGQCALAPVIEVDGEIHAHMNTEKLKEIIEKIKKEDKEKERKKNDDLSKMG